MSPQELADKVGENIGTSEWVDMSQERINQFADATGDHQFIHIDEEKAKMTPFGGTIAHGFLTLSMIPYLGANSDMPKLDGVKMGARISVDGVAVGVATDQFLRYAFDLRNATHDLLRATNVVEVAFAPDEDVGGRFMACSGG